MGLLYKLNLKKDEGVHIYSRIPYFIIDVVNDYREKVIQQGKLNDPHLVEWVKTPPSLDNIVVVDKGEIYFHAGMIDFGGENKGPFWEELKVASDFSVYANQESLPYFGLMRQSLLTQKLKGLYAMKVESTIFPSMTFVPEDIAEAIVKYDLTPHLKKAKKRLDKITKAKRGHRNIA